MCWELAWIPNVECDLWETWVGDFGSWTWGKLFCLMLLFTGCTDDYVSDCDLDKSDQFICPASSCNSSIIYFPCSDGKYCIRKELVCDGYAQCEDESGIIISSMTSAAYFLSISCKPSWARALYMSNFARLLLNKLINEVTWIT